MENRTLGSACRGSGYEYCTVEIKAKSVPGTKTKPARKKCAARKNSSAMPPCRHRVSLDGIDSKAFDAAP
eukprot:scaffold24241_cov53-Attheya_sp.AAC.1